MIKHIFTDLDGTLLNEQGQVTDVTAQTVIDSHIPFTLVSARTPNDMEPIVAKLQLNSPQVAFNGGLIYRKEEDKRVILSESFISWDLAKEIITLIQTNFEELGFSFYDDNNWYTCRLDEGIEKEASIGSQTPQLVEREAFFKQKPVKIYKIMLWIFDEDKMKKATDFFEGLGIEELAIVQSSPFTLELTDSQAKKSKGIDFILNHYQLESHEVAAFGDGHNDIPMLEKVGHPVVMANASDEVKSYAKYLTKSNLENGVSYGINTFFNQK